MQRVRNWDLVVFFVGLFLLLVGHFFITITFLPDSVLKGLRILSYGCFAWCAWRGRAWEKSDGLKVGILLVVGLLGIFYLVFTKQFALFELFLVGAAATNFKFEDVVRADFVVHILIVLILANLWAFGFSDFQVLMRDGSDSARVAYGFSHPNIFSMNLMMLTMDYFYLRRKKLRASDFWVPILMSVFILMSADSRTVVICLVVFMFLNVFRGSWDRKLMSKKALAVYRYLFMGLTAIAVLLTALFSLGVPGYKVMDSAPPLDNTGVRVMLTFGYIGLVFYALYYYKLFETGIRRKDGMLVRILLACLLLGALEMHPLFIYNNIYLVYMFAGGTLGRAAFKRGTNRALKRGT